MWRSCGDCTNDGDTLSRAVPSNKPVLLADADHGRAPATGEASLCLFRDLVHLYSLSAFAVAQPLFDRMSKHTTFLLDRGITRGTLVWLSLLLVLGLPTGLVLVEMLVRACHPSGRRWAHAAFVGGLLLLASAPVARQVTERAWIMELGLACYLALALSAALAYVLTRCYYRTRWFPKAVTCATAGVILFPAAFLGFGPAQTLVFPQPAAVAAARASHPVPVVLVVFDEFCGMSLWNEQHRIDTVRYPHFARLAESATWYRNATTVHPRTGNALPAILTGSMPHGGDRPASEAEYPRNLFRVLQDSGQFEFVVHESVGRLASDDLNDQSPELPASPLARIAAITPTLARVYLHAVIPANLPLETPQPPTDWFGLTSDWGQRPTRGRGVVRNPWGSDRELQCSRFLDCLQASTRPGLFFIHVCLPHYPWCYLPSGRPYLNDRASYQQPLGSYDTHGDSGEIWTDDPLVVRQSWQQYLLQVGYADRFIGQVQDRLREHGLWDDCLLIVTADHGVSFMPGHSRREPEGPNLPDILSVPLFVKYPGQREGRVDDRNVESIDILPTMARELGLELPFPVDGSDFSDPEAPRRPRKTMMRGDGELIVIDPGFPEKFESLRRMLEAFGSGTGEDRLWSFGPSPELIGRPVEQLPRGASTGVQLQLFTPSRSSGSQSADCWPCYISGRVIAGGSRPGPLTLAVSIDGQISGVTHTSTDSRIDDLFAVLVPETMLRGQDPDLQVFAVRGRDAAYVLEPCELTESPDSAISSTGR